MHRQKQAKWPKKGWVLKCKSCTPGYSMNGNSCHTNVCQCNNGIAATGAKCRNSGETSCESCNKGYHVEGQQCSPNQCGCQGGQAVQSTQCITHQTDQCQSCYNSSYLDAQTATCIRKTCSCQNGQGAEGEACPNQGQEQCNSCNEGYIKSGNVCQFVTRGFLAELMSKANSDNESDAEEAQSMLDDWNNTSNNESSVLETDSQISDDLDDFFEGVDEAFNEGIELEDDEI